MAVIAACHEMGVPEKVTVHGVGKIDKLSRAAS